MNLNVNNIYVYMKREKGGEGEGRMGEREKKNRLISRRDKLLPS